MADSKIDFKGLAAAALTCAEQLVAEWLPDGHRAGPEWKALNPTRADGRAGSFSINLTNGQWADFACDDKGGDLVSLYAYTHCNGDQVQAAKWLADRLGMPDAVPKLGKGAKRAPRAAAKPAAPVADKPKAPKWVPVLPVPADAPPPPAAHEFRGLPSARWEYRDAAGALLGVVCRFETSDGGKEIAPLTYCQHEATGKRAWRWVAWDVLRPMYGLDRLAAKPDATVLLVEGEKCADAAQAELPALAVVSWPGGSNAIDKIDWSPLHGRKVITWADCDAQRKKLTKAEKDAGADPMAQPLLPEREQPGVKAMAAIRAKLQPHCPSLWNMDIPAPGDVAGGWDVADAIAGGLKGEGLTQHIRTLARRIEPDQPSPETAYTAEDAAAGKGGQGDMPEPPDDRWPADDSWRDRLLLKKGEVDDCLANVHDILRNRPEWAGVLAFDEFAVRTIKLKAPPYAGASVGDWEGVDDSRTAIWLTHQEGIAPSSGRVAEAVDVVAQANPIHPVRNWLGNLPAHDGTGRIDHWLSDYLGVADSEYVRRVARFYLIGMIARVMEPGCKFDYCLVLEGKQGRGKSTAFRILGGEWYADTDLDLHNKDSMGALQGVWVYEFAELGSVARAEATKQKSFLSRQTDKYRPVYGRRDIKVPRQVVFGGTTNEWEWNKDPTGGRRFWPVDCASDLNLTGLQAARDQMFSEALAAYLAGERYWPDKGEQAELFDPVQLARQQPESLVDALHDWVEKRADHHPPEFSLYEVFDEVLKLDASKMTRDLQTRVGNALRTLGCTKFEKRTAISRFWYKPPARKVASSEPVSRAVPALSAPANPWAGRDDDVGF